MSRASNVPYLPPTGKRMAGENPLSQPSPVATAIGGCTIKQRSDGV